MSTQMDAARPPVSSPPGGRRRRNGTVQGTIPADRITVIVPSASQPDVWHTLTIFDDGVVACSCRGYAFRRDCRHVRAEQARQSRWNSRTCAVCGATGPAVAFSPVTAYEGGRGYITRHLCSDVRACQIRRATAVA